MTPKSLPYLALGALVAAFASFTSATEDPAAIETLAERIDAYVDLRFEAGSSATSELMAELKESDVALIGSIEELLRAPRAGYPDVADLVGKETEHEVACYHVDYETTYLLYVPEGYSHDVPTPLVIVGHGGNSSMSPERARSVGQQYLQAYAPILSRELGAIVVAPASTRGWGQIGNSLLLSTLSQLKRQFHIDPDRVYLTGQSMGGHMAYRAALTLPDRWAAVSPQSGGYDYVEKGAIGSLMNVPGYVTWGKFEPYGLDVSNRTNAAWGQAFGLDWVYVEKDGGHEIYQDELPKIAEFFQRRPRNLYRDTVYLRQGGAMKFTKTWEIEGWPEHTVLSETRPLRWNVQHWLEVTPRTDETGLQFALAKNLGNNHFEVTTDQVRELSLYLHPRMVDFDKPVRITVNGKLLFEKRVQPDPELMLDTVRKFDDRGRIFWAKVTVPVTTDVAVELLPGPK